MYFDIPAGVWYTGINNTREVTDMTYDALTGYLRALPAGEDTLWVTGHPAPDTDAVVSAVFEAFRLTRQGTPARPVIQGPIPRETAWLMGAVTATVPTADSIHPTVPLVLTDHHDVADYPNPVAAIIDHHPVTDGDFGSAAVEIAAVGAATTLVVRRLRQDGLTPDAACARILLGAILLDTEGLSPHKAKDADREAAAWLTALWGGDTEALFAALRSELLSETDLTALYRRDYRRYAAPDGDPLLGWAILKAWADACPDLDGVRALLAADTAAPTRVAKVVLHHPADGAREEYYIAVGEGAAPLLAAVEASAEGGAVRVAADTVFLPADVPHWGRKRYAARLAEIFR